MRSNERSGLPLKGRPQAKAVWVDLAAVFGEPTALRPASSPRNLPPAPCPRWMRTADGAWVGVVTYIATLTDGTTIKCPDQLLPAHALTPR